MNTKNILKTLALAMLLIPACNKSEIANDENTTKKGFALPVTVNVTREGDDATKATYDDGTKKLSFSAGDKLFVNGSHTAAGQFAGTLDYDAVSGKFSGTIYTESEYTGTAEALLAGADDLMATLLPAGYDTYGYLSIKNEGSYGAYFSRVHNKAFALTKKAALEQFSVEHTISYSSGFALAPDNAIVSFTISGLTANKEVAVSFDREGTGVIGGNVTTSATGVATFAVGVYEYCELENCTLTVDGNNIAMPTKTTEAGHIYNITRSATATTLSELKTAINGGTDCSSYTGWEVNSAGAIAASSVSGTKIGYVAYVSTSDVDAGVSGSRILVIASADAAATTLTWGSNGTARGVEADEIANDLNGYSNTNTLQCYGSEAHPAAYAAWNYSATIPSGGASPAHWFMPTKKQWENMRDAKGGTYGAMATAYGISGHYWTSNEYFNGEDYSECNNYAWRFVTNSGFSSFMKLFDINVRSIFAY